MRKKAIYILIIIFFITSCETMNSVKRGLTGEKKLSTDEQKKIQSCMDQMTIKLDCK